MRRAPWIERESECNLRALASQKAGSCHAWLRTRQAVVLSIALAWPSPLFGKAEHSAKELVVTKTVSRFPESRFHFLKPDLQPLSVAVKPGEMGF